MSQHEPIREQPRRDDESIDRAEESSDVEAGELSFDDLLVAKPEPPDEAPFVRKLQERAETALDEPSAEAAADGDVETVERWPRPVQVLCIMGGSAFCWALILTPFLLF